MERMETLLKGITRNIKILFLVLYKKKKKNVAKFCKINLRNVEISFRSKIKKIVVISFFLVGEGGG